MMIVCFVPFIGCFGCVIVLLAASCEPLLRPTETLRLDQAAVAIVIRFRIRTRL